MTIPDLILPVVRRAILDLLNDIGGQQSEDVIARLLTQLGHRVARRDVANLIEWLSGEGLVDLEQVGPFLCAEITADGIDVSEGKLKIDGIDRHRTGR